MLRPLTLGRTIVNTELVRADVLLSNNDIIDVGGRQFLFLHAILNERLLSAAESGDIPKLQVLRYVLGPIRALTDPGSHSEVAELGCRSCCDLAPMSHIGTGAFGPDVSQLRRTFRGCNLRLYLFHWPTRIRISHVGRTVR
jgi:hypothetical protein